MLPDRDYAHRVRPDDMAKILIIVAVITALGGCSFRMPDLSMPKFKIPRVHKITVQ